MRSEMQERKEEWVSEKISCVRHLFGRESQSTYNWEWDLKGSKSNFLTKRQRIHCVGETINRLGLARNGSPRAFIHR